MTPDAVPLAVPEELQRGLHETREEWLQSARFAVGLLCRTLGREDLGEVELLDVGCGTKIVKTLLDDSLPIGRYVGVDASSAVIEWLRANVADPRFEFHYLDAHNERYNPDGQELASFELLPGVGARRFDLICLFSVFTHLAPHDYVAMLRLLRRHAKPDARLLFSLFVDDTEASPTEDEALRERLASDDPEVRRRTEAAIARAMARRRKPGYGFVDEIPESPLKMARYGRDYALELVAETSGRWWHCIRPSERSSTTWSAAPSEGTSRIGSGPLTRDILRGRCRRRTWRSCASLFPSLFLAVCGSAVAGGSTPNARTVPPLGALGNPQCIT